MYAISFGKVTVSVSGTPTLMSAVLASLGLPSDLKVNKLHFKPLQANTGKSYIGLSDTAPSGKNDGKTTGSAFNFTTGVGLLEELAIPATNGPQDRVELQAGNNELNVVRVADYAVDVQTSTQGVIAWGEVL